MGERALSDTRLSLPLFPFPPSDENKEWKSGAGEESDRHMKMASASRPSRAGQATWKAKSCMRVWDLLAIN